MVTIAHQIRRDKIYTVYYSADTVIKIKGMENATGADLAVGQRIAAVGEPADEGTVLAKRIHVIPGRATGVFTRYPVATDGGTVDITPTSTATGSATPTPIVSPNPSATPEPTIEPTVGPTVQPTPPPGP
jgi:hypothetical protein